MPDPDPHALVEYRLAVAAMYARARHDGPGERSWHRWVTARDRLLQSHSQSAFAGHDAFAGIPYFAYDPNYRIVAELVVESGEPRNIAHSGGSATQFTPVGHVSLRGLGVDQPLTVYWLASYGGGMFVPFGDETSGSETYGGGRYLLDTLKGAYLGGTRSELVLDFNFAYHPSCVYSDRWSCPLSPPDNHVRIPISAGERLDSV